MRRAPGAGLIRRATDADAPAIAALFLRSWDAALPTVARAHPDETALPYWRRTVAAREVWTTDDLAGVLTLHDGWVAHLYLDPDRRGEGLGAAFLDLAKERHPRGLQLWAFAVNAPARRFYARQGFVEVERTDGSGNEEREPDVRCVWSGDSSGPDLPITSR